ncbi:endonuclease/exonuclease/phosphatase family protein [Myceligenerans crystallogenes]|uniref:Endonuclease/exonuclease/phosphatase family protein n=1 Tax=Myceligenerans crystallogenes TaxID=316335 RepID=A0ABP4ZTI6_9MICO
MSAPTFDEALDAGYDDPAEEPRRRGTVWSRGLVLAVLQLLIAAALYLHAQLPDALGIGSLVESVLPWLGALAVLLLLLGLARRSVTATLAFLVPAAAWGWMFWPRVAELFTEADPPRSDVVVVQHNASDTNRDVAGTAGVLLAASPDVVTLDEVDAALAGQYTRAFGDALPYHATRGTVGVWSAHPLRDVQDVDLRPAAFGPGWERGMRATVVPRKGDPGVTVYAVHLPSTRVGPGGYDVAARNESIGKLADVLRADGSDAVVVAGDLNAAVEDRALDPVTALVSGPQDGFGLTFPAAFPMVPIDHVLARGAEVTAVEILGRTGSDHLPVAAHVDLPWS